MLRCQAPPGCKTVVHISRIPRFVRAACPLKQGELKWQKPYQNRPTLAASQPQFQ